MLYQLIRWSVGNPLVVVLLALVLALVGGYSFVSVNVEAYPDPAPAIVEVVAQYPGASAEEVERLVTVPLEVTLAGMPGLQYTRTKSLFGLSHLRNQFDYGIDFDRAKQEVINRLQLVSLPSGVTPQISPLSPTGEIMRYTLAAPKDARGQDIYSLNDLKALQDWTLVRELLRVPRVAGVVSSGGTTKRYEIHPDPDRLLRYGVTLPKLQTALAACNANVGGDYLVQGHTVQVIRGLGLLGDGEDPMARASVSASPWEAELALRSEERRRLREIREIVLASTNNVPVRVDDVVNGGPVRQEPEPAGPGVLVGHRTRMGKVSFSYPRTGPDGRPAHDEHGDVAWSDDEERVQGVVLLRKGQESLPALRDLSAKIQELNDTPGRLLPGVKIEPYYNRSGLIAVTTETVRENLVVGLALVSLILLMFLGNVRTALIVALNIPLALAFAFGVLFLRGKSANLLSIGAVDFGIVVDSTVIMVENIYRHVTSGEHRDVPLKDRILKASREVQRSLLFSTIIMVCALVPLFTMKGPEGQIFGPMADTYAFALGGALLLALTVSPVLCLLLFKRLKPARDNFLVRWIKAGYLWQLERCLNFRWLAVAGCALLAAGTIAVLPFLGREFMPELEEGNLWIRGTFPINISLDHVADRVRVARSVMRKYPEVEVVMSQIGRPDDGTDPTGFYNAEFFVPLKPMEQWPVVPALGRRRDKAELVREMNAELEQTLEGTDWDFSQNIRDNVMESLSGVKGENSVKIFGPDLTTLERLAGQVKTALTEVPGIQGVGVFRIEGQSNLEFSVDRSKCSSWNISVADVENVIETAVGGKAATQMIEGEKSFDVTVRWPEDLRCSEQSILQIPVDVTGHTVTPGTVSSQPATPQTGASSGTSPTGSSALMPALSGSQYNAPTAGPYGFARRRLGQLLSPRSKNGQFVRPGASTIYREQGNRLIAIKFGVRGRDLAGAVADAQAKVVPLIQSPYRAEWSGEFQEMQEAEHRLLLVVSLSLALIVVLLYLAFRSLLDALVVLANVGAMALGGVWALILTGNNFNISAAVGFISILGVAVMNGLLMVSSFNALRAHGVPLREALRQGVDKLVRPVTMTALAAILGLLPAALSTRIGSQSQRPLAIVVVGGMILTLVLMNLVPILYSFYGHREPPEGAGAMAH